MDERDQHDGKRAPAFPVVGIGASAGGLKAAGAFLDNMPADTGMAFVLVFHLDPRHKSEAAELLQARSRMPVAQVKGTTRLQPNHVYVIPPSHGLELLDGELALTDMTRVDGRPAVIDRFFRSMAAHAGDRAIGVVLSGTGTEGSQGLKAIKEAGGLTVVQDETEAEYGGMPHSAIATGLIDFVLPVAAIPPKLLEVKDFAVDFALPGKDSAVGESDAENLQKIFVQLRTRTGHDFSHYKQNTILRRIARRMQVHKLQILAEYLELLRATPAEAEALNRELLISVTNFFRDPEAMEALARDMLPKLCKRMEGGTLRVWVAGCATGEEAYTLAMLFQESCDGLATPPRMQIFASDVDGRALDIARRGAYPEVSAADLSNERLKRFFDRSGDGITVKPFLREMILYTHHDLLQDPPFSRLDLISCRNVLIYLKNDIQSRIFELFHFALRPQGYLFLGGSESLGESARLFNEVDRKARIFQSRRVPVTEVPFPVLPNPVRPGVVRRPPDSPRLGFEDIARGELLTGFAPPCVIVDEKYDVTYVAGRVGRYLEPGAGEGNFNVLDMAREDLRLELRSALYKVFHGGEGIERKPVRVRVNGAEEAVSLTVRPLTEADGHAMVVFEPVEAGRALPERVRVEDSGGVVAQLENELTTTRESLQTSIEELETSNEELRASNEELQSVNEELQSTTEELETGKEELQSTNEELLAVNQELRVKNEELARSYGDLNNLIASTDIGTLFLDGELRVRRYTPRAAEVFNLIPGDVGRPLAHLASKLAGGDLVADATQVLEELAPVTRELSSIAGRTYQVRLRPYRDADSKIGGVVLVFVDITEIRRAEAALRASDLRFRALVTATSEVTYRLSADWGEMTSLKGSGFLADTTAPSRDWFEAYIPPGERERVRAAIDAAIHGRTSFELEHRVIRANGGIGWTASRATPILDEHGEISEWFGAAVDITERRLRERWLRTQNRLLEVIAAGAPLDEVLRALCEAVSHLAGARAAVLFANEERTAVTRIVATDIPLSFGEGLAGAPISDLYVGTCGTAIHEGKPVSCPDIAHDERWSKEWRDLCETHGVRACHSTPVLDADGTPRASLVLCFDRPHELDAWERRLAEFGAHIASIAIQRERAGRELRESERRYRTLFDTMDDAFCIIEMIFDDAGKAIDFRYLQTNGAFERHATRPMLGKRIREIVPNFEQSWIDDYARVARTGEPAHLEGIVHGLGNQWFQTSAVRFGESGGNRVAVLFRNITASKHAERETAQLASIVFSSDDAIISKNLKGVVETWNRAAERMFGYSAEEAIGKSITELIMPADRMAEEDEILRRIGRGESIDHFETVRRRKDGSLLDASVTISPLIVAGRVVGASKIARDVSERKRRERNLTFLGAVRDDLARLLDIGATMRVLGARIGDWFGLSHLLFVELDAAAGLATVRHGWHRDGIPAIAGTYRIEDFLDVALVRRACAGETVVIDDTAGEGRVDAERLAALGIRSFVIVPAVRGGVMCFWFGLYRSDPHAWAGEEIALINEITGRVWMRLERARAEQALGTSEVRYRTLFDSIDEGFCIIEMLYDDAGRPSDYRFLEVNPAFGRHTGFADAVGHTVRELAPEQEQYWFDIYGKVAATGEPVRFEQRGAGMGRVFEAYAFRIGEPGQHRVAVLFTDVTVRKHTEEHRELLIHELNHRVKNTLATVQALAMHSFRGPGAQRGLATFEARLLALSAAHDVLTRENWKGAGIDEIVRDALAAWSGGVVPRIRISGRDLRLAPPAALALAMALHELATNATKYGSLSKKRGSVAVEWSVAEQPPVFRFKWRELDGPPVRRPSRQGFGTRLIEHGLAQDLGGKVELLFNPDGLECRVEVPLTRIHEQEPSR